MSGRVLRKQEQYQQRNKALGLCRQCRGPLWHHRQYCCRCIVLEKLTILRLPYLARHKKERLALIMFVMGLFMGAELGTSRPIESWEDVAAMVDARFKWRESEWKAASGVRFAKWIYRWDRDLRSGKR